jgi:NADPH:quinone reductase-like Zn-dependent oxidoreductase
MKAAIRFKYGSPKVLEIKEVEKPVPKENEVLVKVKATTVNRTDYGILVGKPMIMRWFFTGYPNPKYKTMGCDFAGIVEAVGSRVLTFKTGDKVMGFGLKATSHAEWLTFPVDKGIIRMPDGLSFDEAAASLEGAFYAQSAINYLKPNAGREALVNGATGAIGSATIQFLKYYGVRTTAVCGGENRELMISLGASRVFDYKTEDFLKDTQRYDYIFDHVAGSSFKKCKHLLKPQGIYLPSDGLENFLLMPWTKLKGGKQVKFIMPGNVNKGLHFILDMIAKGAFKPIIDRTYPFSRIREAYEYVGTGQKIGNIILKIDEV